MADNPAHHPNEDQHEEHQFEGYYPDDQEYHSEKVRDVGAPDFDIGKLHALQQCTQQLATNLYVVTPFVEGAHLTPVNPLHVRPPSQNQHPPFQPLTNIQLPNFNTPANSHIQNHFTSAYRAAPVAPLHVTNMVAQPPIPPF